MVLSLVFLGLAITLEPLPLTGFILVLSAERGIIKGLGFILGWVTCLGVIVIGTVALTGGHPPEHHSAPGTGLLVGTAALGLLLVAVGVRRSRRLRHPQGPRKPPSWMGRIDRLSPVTAAGLAVLLQPWPLVAAGAVQVAQAELTSAGEWLVLVGFCVLATSSQLVLELWATFSPEKATAAQARIRAWIETHRDQVVVVLALLIGFWLLGKGLYGLVT